MGKRKIVEQHVPVKRQRSNQSKVQPFQENAVSGLPKRRCKFQTVDLDVAVDTCSLLRTNGRKKKTVVKNMTESDGINRMVVEKTDVQNIVQRENAFSCQKTIMLSQAVEVLRSKKDHVKFIEEMGAVICNLLDSTRICSSKTAFILRNISTYFYYCTSLLKFNTNGAFSELHKILVHYLGKGGSHYNLLNISKDGLPMTRLYHCFGNTMLKADVIENTIKQQIIRITELSLGSSMIVSKRLLKDFPSDLSDNQCAINSHAYNDNFKSVTIGSNNGLIHVALLSKLPEKQKSLPESTHLQSSVSENTECTTNLYPENLCWLDCSADYQMLNLLREKIPEDLVTQSPASNQAVNMVASGTNWFGFNNQAVDLTTCEPNSLFRNLLVLVPEELITRGGTATIQLSAASAKDMRNSGMALIPTVVTTNKSECGSGTTYKISTTNYAESSTNKDISTYTEGPTCCINSVTVPITSNISGAVNSKPKKSGQRTSSSKNHYCKKGGERYRQHFKDKVLAYATKHTFQEAAHKFKVNIGTVSRWSGDKNRAKLSNKIKIGDTHFFDVKKVASKEIPADEQFVSWVRLCREQKLELTEDDIKNKARQKLSEAKDCPAWFIHWVQRFDEENNHAVSSKEKKRHIRYSSLFKHEVAAFASSHTQLLAAKLFSVSRKRVFEWIKVHLAKEANKEEQEKEKAPTGRGVTNEEVDRKLWEWYKAQELTPRREEVCAKGIELYRAQGCGDIKCSYGWFIRWCTRFGVAPRHTQDEPLVGWVLTELERGRGLTHSDLQQKRRSTRFKASSGWAIRFCKRHPELLQNCPSLQTQLPLLLECQVEVFRHSVRETVKQCQIGLEAMGCVDEIHLSFSGGSGTGSKRRLVLRRPGNENCHATIILSCLADGTLLPPALIMKGNSDVEPQQQHGVLILHQEAAQLDHNCMLQWLKQIWFQKVVCSNSLLLMDCFDAHIAAPVAELLSTRSCKSAVIPGGCSSKLQPLEVYINSTFQAAVEKKWFAFNAKSGPWGPKLLQLPSSDDIAQWVHQTYHTLNTTKQEVIRRSFLVTGLTVASNNSEDHFIEDVLMLHKNISD